MQDATKHMHTELSRKIVVASAQIADICEFLQPGCPFCGRLVPLLLLTQQALEEAYLQLPEST